MKNTIEKHISNTQKKRRADIVFHYVQLTSKKREKSSIMIKEFFQLFLSFILSSIYSSLISIYIKDKGGKKRVQLSKAITMLFEDEIRSKQYFDIGFDLSEQLKQEFYQHLKGNEQFNSDEKRK